MAVIRVSAPLCRELQRVFPVRPFHVRFWDGGVVAATSPDAPTFFVNRPAALAHFLRAPDSLGLGRAYVEGLLAVDDLDAAFLVVDTWEAPPLALARPGRASGPPCVLPRRPADCRGARRSSCCCAGSCHTIERDAAAVRYHYDVGNEFFALFLDESMTYSCAIFSRGAETLEEAQRTKLELVATKLGLRAGHAGAGRRLRLGQLRDPRRARTTASRCSA